MLPGRRGGKRGAQPLSLPRRPSQTPVCTVSAPSLHCLCTTATAAWRSQLWAVTAVRLSRPAPHCDASPTRSGQLEHERGRYAIRLAPAATAKVIIIVYCGGYLSIRRSAFFYLLLLCTALFSTPRPQPARLHHRPPTMAKKKGKSKAKGTPKTTPRNTPQKPATRRATPGKHHHGWPDDQRAS